MTVGQRIKMKRESLNMSQVDLANKIGCTKQTLYKYENDIITNIPSTNIEKIAQALETTPAYLMGWENNSDEKDVKLANYIKDYFKAAYELATTVIKEQEERKELEESIYEKLKISKDKDWIEEIDYQISKGLDNNQRDKLVKVLDDYSQSSDCIDSKYNDKIKSLFRQINYMYELFALKYPKFYADIEQKRQEKLKSLGIPDDSDTK